MSWDEKWTKNLVVQLCHMSGIIVARCDLIPHDVTHRAALPSLIYT